MMKAGQDGGGTPSAPSTTVLLTQEQVMARQSLSRFRSFVEGNPGPHICRCGCGQELVLKPHHILRGIPTYLPHHRPSQSDAVRFWLYVRKGGPNECWPWTGACDGNGYGCCRANGRQT